MSGTQLLCPADRCIGRRGAGIILLLYRFLRCNLLIQLRFFLICNFQRLLEVVGIHFLGSRKCDRRRMRKCISSHLLQRLGRTDCVFSQPTIDLFFHVRSVTLRQKTTHGYIVPYIFRGTYLRAQSRLPAEKKLLRDPHVPIGVRCHVLFALQQFFRNSHSAPHISLYPPRFKSCMICMT